MKATDLFVRCLEQEGVRYVFGVPGEETLDLLDSLSRSEQITFVVARHEQGAARQAALDELERHRADAAFPVTPQRLVADLRAALDARDVVISDVGAHKLWLAMRFLSAHPNTLVVANGLASMGIAVPGALAAKLVHPDRKVVAVSGDGRFLMNAQELETAKRLGTAFVTIVCTDQHYGVIELHQQRRFGRAFGVEFANPDLVTFAAAFGLPGFRVERTEDLLPVLRRALDLDVPSLVEVPIDRRENARLGAG